MIRPPRVAETRLDAEKVQEYVIRLAREKALAVERNADEMILSADTVVVIDGEILEKPRDPQDAARMLRLLSGREHRVMTGICIIGESKILSDISQTRVRFVRFTEMEIADYVASGEPMDKAGAYAIQGLASKFIDHIEGCYFNVVGLPISLVYRRLKELGFARENA